MTGFSVHAEQLVYDDKTQKLENLALYPTRAPIKLSSITQTPEGQVCVTTPSHPLSGNTVLVLDALDWIHAICQQILPWVAPSQESAYRLWSRGSNEMATMKPRAVCAKGWKKHLQSSSSTCLNLFGNLWPRRIPSRISSVPFGGSRETSRVGVGLL
jgi:hypothetical protein